MYNGCFVIPQLYGSIREGLLYLKFPLGKLHNDSILFLKKSFYTQTRTHTRTHTRTRMHTHISAQAYTHVHTHTADGATYHIGTPKTPQLKDEGYPSVVYTHVRSQPGLNKPITHRLTHLT